MSREVDDAMPDLARATRPELEGFLERDPLLVLPVGSVEQHGPHLPLLMDSCIAEDLARSLRLPGRS